MTRDPTTLNPGDRIYDADAETGTDVQFTVLAHNVDPRPGRHPLVTWEIVGPDDEGRHYTFYELSELFGCKRPRTR